MNFVNIDTKLSKEFEITLKIPLLQLKLSEAVRFEGMSSILRDKNNYFSCIFLPKTDDIERFKPFFPLAYVQERRLYYMSIEQIKDDRSIQLIGDIDNINGLVISYVRVNNGNLTIQGFMHKNAQNDFSNVLSRHIGEKSFIEKIIVKPTDGMINSMEKIHMALKSILISLPLSEFKHYRIIKLMEETGTIGQFIDNYPLDGEFRVILYSDRDISSTPGIKTISSTDFVYETKTDDGILLLLASKAYEQKITWNFLFYYVSNNKLFINFILPEFRAKEYLQLISDTEMDLKKLDLATIESYCDSVNKKTFKGQ